MGLEGGAQGEVVRDEKGGKSCWEWDGCDEDTKIAKATDDLDEGFDRRLLEFVILLCNPRNLYKIQNTSSEQ